MHFDLAFLCRIPFLAQLSLFNQAWAWQWLMALAVAMFTYAAIQKQHFTVVTVTVVTRDVSSVYFVQQSWFTVAGWQPPRGTKKNHISVSDFLS